MQIDLKKIILPVYFFFLVFGSVAQAPQQYNAAQVQLAMNKLKVLGSVLYLAAHPDDENTRMIAYLANGALAKTGYLSMTRGDGGQNLIGPEIREALGLIRTQELLAARRKDGGAQFFTRANDFGYSKSPEETFSIWDKEKVLADVVWTIRKFRPDVIITRFPGDGRGRHGHHTASALLAAEAFDISGNPESFPEQLEYVQPWQPKRLMTNTGRWWNPDMTEDTEGVITVDVGNYSPLLGRSFTEIAADSRSQHKSQGFGSSGSRGSQIEFLEHVKGVEAEKGVFDGIDTSWGRIKGGKVVGERIDKLIATFDPMHPAASVPQLLEIRTVLQSLEEGPWKQLKTKETEELIRACLGLFIEAKASAYHITPGSELDISFELIQRSGQQVKVKKLQSPKLSIDTALNQVMDENEAIHFKVRRRVPMGLDYSSPYWLKEPASLGMYTVENQEMIGKAENGPAIPVMVSLEVEGKVLVVEIPVTYQWTDPVKGGLYRPLVIIPPVMTHLSEEVYIFPDEASKEVTVLVKSGKAGVKGTLRLDLPHNWRSDPSSQPFSISEKGGELSFSFQVFPPEGQSSGEVRAIASVNGKDYGLQLLDIAYDHIPRQALLSGSKSKVVRLDIRTEGKRVGYLRGAGDAIPASLRNIGYEIQELETSSLNPAQLSELDAVVLGIRALNTRERISFEMKPLLEYVAGGGTLIIQYNTSHRLKTDDFSPYPIRLSRKRVTDERAPVEILAPQHPVMNHPNKITSADFEGWVQERGLYFPDQWDERYEAILSSHDAGEEPLHGGMLIAPYGKGHYIYTGYSWFRELPAGIPGAYRLFANMVSLGKNSLGGQAGKIEKPLKPTKKNRKKSKKRG